jgi:hypothetical protein
MEKIQECALRFIYEDFNSDYDTLLLKSGLPSLKIRRLRMMAIEIFKAVSVNWPKPGYASITCSTISNIPYNLIFTTKFNDSSILITIISCDYLNLSLADEHVGDVTIPTQVIEYNQNFLHAD